MSKQIEVTWSIVMEYVQRIILYYYFSISKICSTHKSQPIYSTLSIVEYVNRIDIINAGGIQRKTDRAIGSASALDLLSANQNYDGVHRSVKLVPANTQPIKTVTALIALCSMYVQASSLSKLQQRWSFYEAYSSKRHSIRCTLLYTVVLFVF